VLRRTIECVTNNNAPAQQLRTMRIIVPVGSGLALNPSINTRQYLLLGVAVAQFFVAWFLGLSVTSLSNTIAQVAVPVIHVVRETATAAAPIAAAAVPVA
jgi:hypothetical protein